MKKENRPTEYYFEENCYITELLNSASDPLVSVARARVLPGVTTRWHSVQGTVERYVILEGQGCVEIGEDSPLNVYPGESVTIPPGIRQRITNTGHDDLIFLAVCTPRFIPERYCEE